MNGHVDISFECLPLRSVSRFDVPIDASPEYEAWVHRVKRATEKHGRHNTYYLHDAECLFSLTNAPDVGTLRFRFEGTVLTDEDDQRTFSTDLEVELVQETCDWITEPIVRWFSETVSRAVQVEFDLYISSGSLEKTVKRIEKVRAESDAQGGFLGMGL